jgi:hypothetical protein
MVGMEAALEILHRYGRLAVRRYLRDQRCAAAIHLIGQGRQAEGYALPGVAFRVAVERLMLPVLLE